MTFIALVLLVFVIMLGLRVSGLSSEVRRLGLRVDALDGSKNVTQTAEPVQSVPQAAQPGVHGIQTAAPVEEYAYVQGPDYMDDFVKWFRTNWLLKTGVLLILIGFGWFVSYAFIHDWIGPMERIILGFLVGMSLAFAGTWRMTTSPTQGKLLLILGSGLTLITSFAARAIYEFYSATTSLGIVFLVSAYVSAVAVYFKSRSLAIYGLVIAYLVPFLTHTSFDVTLLFSYLAVVSVASMWLAGLPGWRDVNAVSLLGYGFFALQYMFGIFDLTDMQEFFVLAMTSGLAFVYLVIMIMGAIKAGGKPQQGDMLVVLLDAALIICSVLSLVPEQAQTFMLLAWALVFLVGGIMAFTYTKSETFFYVYSLVAVLLVVIATAVELDGHALVYAYAIESAIVSVAGYLVTRRLNVGYNLSMLMAGPALLALPSIFSSKWRTSIAHDDFGVLVTVGILLCGLGLFYYFSEQEKEKYGDATSESLYPYHFVIGSAFFLVLVWLCSKAAFLSKGTEVLVPLVVYTIIGIATYFYGLTEKKDLWKYYGATLLVFVIGRLVLVDVWDMALASRVVTFISIGLLFISTAFFGKKVTEENK